MSLEDGHHDVGGVLDREVPSPGPDRRHREARELPFLRLMQRRAPRARHTLAGHRLGLALDDRVDDEVPRQVAPPRGSRPPPPPAPPLPPHPPAGSPSPPPPP